MAKDLAYGIWVIKAIFIALTPILSVVWIIRFKKWLHPIHLLTLWVIICDLLGTIMLAIMLFRGAYNANHQVFGRFYPVVALTLLTWAITRMVRDRVLRKMVRAISVTIVLFLIGYLIHLISEGTLINRSLRADYAIMVPAAISILILYMIDLVVSPRTHDIRGMQWYFRSWIFYYTLCYMGWIARNLRPDIDHPLYKYLYYTATESIIFFGYICLVAFQLVAMLKFNIPKEWDRETTY